MGKIELTRKSRQELMEIAREKGLVGRSKMKKDELVSSLAKLLKPSKASAARKKPENKGGIARKKDKAVAAPLETKTETWQEKVEDSKYYLGAEEKGFITDEELPAGYGDNKLVLMVRDPHWAYVYWEINSVKIAEAKSKLKADFDNSRLILRVFDITDIDFNGENAHSFFDIEIPNVLGNWYVNLGVPNRTFCMDIGYRKPDGGMFILSRSNIITSPRDTISDIQDEEWMTSEEEFQGIYAGTFGSRGVGSSAELAQMMKRRFEREISSGGLRGFSLKESPTKH